MHLPPPLNTLCSSAIAAFGYYETKKETPSLSGLYPCNYLPDRAIVLRFHSNYAGDWCRRKAIVRAAKPIAWQVRSRGAGGMKATVIIR